MMVDKGKKTSVSSVNFSYTSFMKNREAGVVFTDACDAVVSFYSSVFENDWDQGIEYEVAQTYNSSAMEYITDPAMIQVKIPPKPCISDAYVAPLSTLAAQIQAVYTGPDFAKKTIRRALKKVQSTLYIMIYKITDMQLCNYILRLYQKGIDVKLLVSDRVYGYDGWKLSEKCYQKLYDGGMNNGVIQNTPSFYKYSHQKVWIVDNTTVHLSSGNWSPSGFPDGDVFPPYGSPRWQRVNRDLLVVMGKPAVETFYSVFKEDWHRGKPWHP
jgi:phosphatidylserine/phosphatidylglycerophosphate/cardiolipin synthase-like enzyme